MAGSRRRSAALSVDFPEPDFPDDPKDLPRADLQFDVVEGDGHAFLKVISDVEATNGQEDGSVIGRACRETLPRAGSPRAVGP